MFSLPRFPWRHAFLACYATALLHAHSRRLQTHALPRPRFHPPRPMHRRRTPAPARRLPLRSDPRAQPALPPHRARLPPHAFPQFRPRRHQRRDLGHLRQHPAPRRNVHPRAFQLALRRPLARHLRAHLAYLGDDPAPYREHYRLLTPDDPAAWAKLIHLCKTLHETRLDQLEAALAPQLDFSVCS